MTATLRTDRGIGASGIATGGRRLRASTSGSTSTSASGSTSGSGSGSGKQMIAILRTQGSLVDLSDRGMRNFIDKDDVVGHPPGGDLAFQKVEQRLFVRDATLFKRDDQ